MRYRTELIAPKEAKRTEYDRVIAMKWVGRKAYAVISQKDRKGLVSFKDAMLHDWKSAHTWLRGQCELGSVMLLHERDYASADQSFFWNRFAPSGGFDAASVRFESTDNIHDVSHHELCLGEIVKYRAGIKQTNQ